MTEQSVLTVLDMKRHMEYATDGVCHCPEAEIQYLITVDNDQAVNVKTGKCLRCAGTRKSKITGKILTGKRRLK